MGSTLGNFQILGASEEAMRAALPDAIVGCWFHRFVTACPDELFFDPLEKEARRLSRQLDCTVLAVSLFDSDALSLALYAAGKRVARHASGLDSEENVPGNARAFCAGLGLDAHFAPLLKRLFTETSQEEKLEVLSALLGAPLFARWDVPFAAPVTLPPNEGPLQAWVAAHPLPPKVKNQTRLKLVQEITDRWGSPALIFRPVAYIKIESFAPIETIERRGGEWGRWDENGRLELTPLEEEGLTEPSYATDGKRLLTIDGKHLLSPPETVRIVADSAGRLPLPLTLAGAEQLLRDIDCVLLPDGGFLVVLYPQDEKRLQVLRRYSAEGVCLWDWSGRIQGILLLEDRIFVISEAEGEWTAHCLTLAGREVCSASLPSYGPLLTSGEYLYQIDNVTRHDFLHRFTRDPRPTGRLELPSLYTMAVSPDGSLLVCAGTSSILVTVSPEDLRPMKELRRGRSFYTVMIDAQNRIWAHDGAWLECYSAGLELLSRHRLSGEILNFAPGREGGLCLAVGQFEKHLTRVYHAN